MHSQVLDNDVLLWKFLHARLLLDLVHSQVPMNVTFHFRFLIVSAWNILWYLTLNDEVLRIFHLDSLYVASGELSGS